MSSVKLFGGIAVFGLIALFALYSDVDRLVDDGVSGQFVTGIHMGAPSKNVKLSRQLIDGKEVMKAIIVPDKPLTKVQCRAPMCWYEDRYKDSQRVERITGKRDVKGVNINRCHSENALVEVRVGKGKDCFAQKIYCRPNGTWTVWQGTKKC
ncbi:hypothetical protein HY490_04575 [Candidatus Woesearchaeota archaeon]|nr:hypothetical protein [Candidatus Woesearchaeota archaeon]